MTTSGREALAEAAALERARVTRPCHQHHHTTNSSTGPADPQQLAELIAAIVGDTIHRPLAGLPWAEMTPAERTYAVGDLRAAGQSWRDIARLYSIDPRTVRKALNT